MKKKIKKLGKEIFGNKKSFKQWKNTKNFALGGQKPKNVSKKELYDELNRIVYGCCV